MDKSQIAKLWWVCVCDLRAWGWSFTSGAKDIGKEEMQDWVNHFQWKWHANQGGFFACLLFQLCEQFPSQHPPLNDPLAMREWVSMNIRPMLQVMVLELAINLSGPHHWSLHGIPEPIMEWMLPCGQFALGILKGGVIPDWIPKTLSRPDPTKPHAPKPIEIVPSLLPVQIDN